MTRRDWWIGIGLLTAAILGHAIFPRYEIRTPFGDRVWLARVDRWTGTIEVTGIQGKTSDWLRLPRVSPSPIVDQTPPK